MKFISKFANYRVVLRHGQPAEPLTGRSAVPGLYIKFENGIVDVINEEYCKLMREHEKFGSDFILADGEVDPYANRRGSSEPPHTLTQIEYGHVGKAINPNPPIQLSADKKKLLEKMAIDMAKEMAKPMAKEMAKDLLREVLAEAEKKKSMPVVNNLSKPSKPEQIVDKPIKPKIGRPKKEVKLEVKDEVKEPKEEVKEPMIEANT